jgi:WD40 repeat protein
MSVSSFIRFLSCVFPEGYSGGLKRFLVTPFLVALLAPASAFASDPILTVDSGGHQPVIRDLNVSADGRYLVSGSRDKIIRVWDTRTQKEVRKILGQVGEGPDGMVYAIALSRDDRWRHPWLITQQFQ